MKTFICVLALVSAANALFLGGGNSNSGGYNGPPPHVHHHAKHVVNVFHHHSAPAPVLVPSPVAVPVAVPVAYGGGGHEHVVKVIHESGGHGGLLHGGLSHGGGDLQVALHHAPLVHHAPVHVLKVLHGHEHAVHPIPEASGWW